VVERTSRPAHSRAGACQVLLGEPLTAPPHACRCRCCFPIDPKTASRSRRVQIRISCRPAGPANIRPSRQCRRNRWTHSSCLIHRVSSIVAPCNSGCLGSPDPTAGGQRPAASRLSQARQGNRQAGGWSSNRRMPLQTPTARIVPVKKQPLLTGPGMRKFLRVLQKACSERPRSNEPNGCHSSNSSIPRDGVLSEEPLG